MPREEKRAEVLTTWETFLGHGIAGLSRLCGKQQLRLGRLVSASVCPSRAGRGGGGGGGSLPLPVPSAAEAES